MDTQALGANFTIDITDLKAGLLQANRLIRESETEFKAAAAGMDDWTSSADGLKARIKNLTTVTDLQRKKVDALTAEYNKLVKDGLDESSKAAVELRTKINQEQAALNKNEKELEQQTKALEDMGDETKESAGDTEKLGKAAEKSGDGFSIAKSAIAGFIANGLTALVSKVGEAVGALFGLAESTRELRNELNRLETGFESAGLKAEDAAKTYDTLYGVLGDTGKASEAASHLALLANNAEDLQKWTDICTGVYAAFGDSLPIEGLTEAANETAKTGSLTGVLADALNWAGVNEDDFQKKLDACTTEQERQALITETLSGLYDAQAEAFKENNKSIIEANEATNKLAQAQAELGEAMEPLNTAITNLKTSLLEEFSPAIQQIIKDLEDVFKGVEGAPERLANTVSEFIGDIVAKATEFIPKVGEFAVQLVFMLAQTLIENLPAIVEAALQLMSTFIETLASMAPSLIMTIVEAVVDIAETIVDNIDMVIDAGIQLIKGLAAGLLEALPFLVSKIPTIIQKLVDTLISNLPKILDTGSRILVELINGIMKAIPDLLAALPTIIASIVKGLLTEGIPALISAGGQLLAGLFQGMLNPQVIWDNITKMGSAILDGVKSFFGIHSPSRVFEDEIGRFMGEGMALGLGEGFSDRLKSVGAGIKSAAAISGGIYQTGAGMAYSGAGGSSGGQTIVINQNNTFASQKGSRYEKFTAKQQTAAAVRLAIAAGGGY